MTAFDEAWTLLKELSPSAQDMNNTASRQLYLNRMGALGSKMNPSLQRLSPPHLNPYKEINYQRAMNPEIRRQRNILGNARRSYSNSPNVRGPRESNYAQTKQDEISQQIAVGPSMNPDMEREQQSLMGSRSFRTRMGRDRGVDSPRLGDWNRLGVNQ